MLPDVVMWNNELNYQNVSSTKLIFNIFKATVREKK